MLSSFVLEAPFPEEEILSVFKDADGDKVLGLDGFFFSNLLNPTGIFSRKIFWCYSIHSTNQGSLI